MFIKAQDGSILNLSKFAMIKVTGDETEGFTIRAYVSDPGPLPAQGTILLETKDPDHVKEVLKQIVKINVVREGQQQQVWEWD